MSVQPSSFEKIKYGAHDFYHHKERGLFLRPLTESDLPFTLLWRNIYKTFFNSTNEIVLADHLQWYNHYQKKTDDLVLIILDAQNNRIGQAAIYNIHWESRCAEFGRFMVNPDFAGQGFMKNACEAMLVFSKQQLGLLKIHLEVKPENLRARHIYEQCNFKAVHVLENFNVFMECFLDDKS